MSQSQHSRISAFGEEVYTPSILAMHTVAERYLVTRFLQRNGEVVWMIDDMARADEDPAQLGVEVFQGNVRGCRARLRELLRG